MPTYLVPAMLRIEAESETEANDLARDVVTANLSTHSIYLDEGIPTVEIVGCDIEYEFPHTMLDERVAPALFPQPVLPSMFTVIADVDGCGSRMDSYRADTPADAFLAFLAEHASGAEHIALIAIIEGEHTDRRNEATAGDAIIPCTLDLEA